MATVALSSMFATLSLATTGPAAAEPGDITLVSTSDDGENSNGGDCCLATSEDGTKVAFSSQATNLDPADVDTLYDVYLKDLVTGDITLVSTSDTGEKGEHESFAHAVSADGTKVVFTSWATTLDPADTETDLDVYLKDLSTGDITLVSTSDTGEKGNHDSLSPDLSADERHVAFSSYASNLDDADTNAAADVFVKDLLTGDLVLASSSDRGRIGNSDSFGSSLSADGSAVTFMSSATNLDGADTDTLSDVYVKDLVSGDVVLVSTATNGEKSNGPSEFPSLDDDATTVAFVTSATNLDPMDSNATPDVYVKDLSTGEITAASVSDTGVFANGWTSGPSLSSDGTSVSFQSEASNLDPFDPDSKVDVFHKDLLTGDLALVSTTAAGDKGNGASTQPLLSADATHVVFVSDATNLHPDDADAYRDTYVKELGGVVPIPRCAGVAATMIGTSSVDLIVGTPGKDVIVGSGGNDWIAGRGGGDTICGGPGHDYIEGGAGGDRLIGGNGSDELVGKPGDDDLVGGPGGDDLVGSLGSDTLRGGNGSDTLYGKRGDDSLWGGTEDDSLRGGPGVDVCHGGPGTDTASGLACETTTGVP